MKPDQSQAAEATLVQRFLAGLVGTVCRFPRAVLALSLILAALSIYASLTHLEYFTQRSDLISPRKDSQQRWRQYLAEFGDDDDIVVVLKGNDRPRMEQALESLAGSIQQQPDVLDRLFYKVDLRALRNRALLFLTTEEIQAIQANLKSMGLLLATERSWQSLALNNLLAEARARLHHVAPGRPLSAGDEQFLTQLLAICHSARATLAEPAQYSNPWSSLVSRPPQQKDLLAEPQYFFSGDSTLAFLLVRPIKEQGSFTAAEKSVSAMRQIVAGTSAAFPELEFGLTGLPVLENDEMTAAQSDTKLASWLAIAGVTILFFAVYRSIYYPLLTVATLLMGTAWAMGWLTLTVGHLNILSATFAVMLIGMGDYGVLWVMRYEQARRQGAEVRSALLHTTRHVAIGNLTAASTLALAFFAAILADFRAVAELGWIAGCGVLLCAFACFTVLPALLMILDRRKLAAAAAFRSEPASHQGPSEGASWLPALFARPRRLVVAGVAVTGVLAFCATRLGYDHNLLHLQARDLDSVKWEMTLIEHTAGASWHALSYTNTPEEALALKARYEHLPEVSRVVEMASLVPADQEYKIALLRDIQRRLAFLPRRGVPIPHARPGRQEIQTQVDNLLTQVRPLADTGRQPLLVNLCERLQALEQQLITMDDTRLVETRLQQFDQRLAGDLAEDLHRLHDVTTPQPITTATLPPALRERYLGQSGKWLLQVFAKDCLWDFEPLEHFVKQIQTVDRQATGKPFGTVEGLKAMKDGFQRAGLYALLVIVAVLLIDFRTIKNAAIALAPLAMGVLLSLGVMGLLGVPLNPANMIALPLILGVGVDNGVHVLHDYLLRRAEGRTTISYAIGRGVLVKALTTIIGFGTLMISSERGLASLGFILTLGVTCSMLSSLIFLPAVLRLLGKPKRAPATLPFPAVAPRAEAA